ncbi:Uncharacterized protein PECH_001573 [Penicillium ucsense]|uniref:Rhodopsin domain-containing protein n=1 Tax=Penicillium ucsense TaxID=2839758 RepID=A0A8J8VYZ5_9EURO|nr:Uncharacterized protein PECM_001075 [Penicillium ucsense]KAF7732645.1 Uncharacterized protein PECH_001573 [Penicillium ucsense]
MDSIPRPGEGDVNIGTNVFIACWVLTIVVGITLLFRYAVKSWVRFALPQVSAPGRIWGYEDLFFLAGFVLDLGHMVMIQMSSRWGLGRHFFYLTGEERSMAMKYDFYSQPLAVAAAMVSRTGMMWFLLTCFAASDKKIRISIIVCAVVQIVVNMVTIVQILVQCGPNPYFATNRVLYFKYMWTPLPSDGSVVCQSPDVQTTVGFVQGGFNTVIDWILAVIAGVELWQFFIRTLHRENLSFWSQFKRINSTVRSRRIWQTLTLCGPLLLSGAASIIKTYKLKSLGDRLDFTYNIVSFILWVKIENYSILLASCAPVARLFLRTIVDARQEGRTGYWSKSNSRNKSAQNEMELRDRRAPDKIGWVDSTTATATAMTQWQDEEQPPITWTVSLDRSKHRVSKGFQGCEKEADGIDSGGVTVQTDIVVQVDNRWSTCSGDARLLPDGGELMPGLPQPSLRHSRG